MPARSALTFELVQRMKPLAPSRDIRRRRGFDIPREAQFFQQSNQPITEIDLAPFQTERR
jgi:hypothetical protein